MRSCWQPPIAEDPRINSAECASIHLSSRKAVRRCVVCMYVHVHTAPEEARRPASFFFFFFCLRSALCVTTATQAVELAAQSDIAERKRARQALSSHFPFSGWTPASKSERRHDRRDVTYCVYAYLHRYVQSAVKIDADPASREDVKSSGVLSGVWEFWPATFHHHLWLSAGFRLPFHRPAFP